MLLAIDVGNTNIVFAVFSGSKLTGKWRLATESNRTDDEYAISLKQLFSLEELEFSEIDSVIISCVVPSTLFALKTLARKYFKCEPMVVGDDGVAIPVTVKIDRHTEVGADRIVNAVAANKLYRRDVIIIDFGTATTFDVVSAKGEYLGGVISPGVDLSLSALHDAAAKLPKVAIGKPDNVIGKNTISAMKSGIYWGYVGLVEGIVGKIKKEYGKNMKVIATGGLAPLFAEATSVIESHEPDLTIDGLQYIHEINQNKVRKLKKA